MIDNHIVRPMTVEDAPMVLNWRNHEDVRRNMFCSDPIDLPTHLQWFQKASDDPLRNLLIYQHGDRPLGFVQFTQESPDEKTFSWGFYVSPDAPKGTGKHLGKAALHHAFHTMGAASVNGQVIAFNSKSIRFHLNLGFLQTDVMKQHHFDGCVRHDVVCLRLELNEWKALNPVQPL